MKGLEKENSAEYCTVSPLWKILGYLLIFLVKQRSKAILPHGLNLEAHICGRFFFLKKILVLTPWAVWTLLEIGTVPPFQPRVPGSCSKFNGKSTEWILKIWERETETETELTKWDWEEGGSINLLFPCVCPPTYLSDFNLVGTIPVTITF